MFLLKEITDDLRLSLAPIQMAAHAGHHLAAVCRTGFAQGVGFDILIEQLVGIQFRTVAWHADQTQLLGVRLDELLGQERSVYGKSVAMAPCEGAKVIGGA